MKLIYRGLSYELLPLVVETVEGKVGGQFRGLDWRFHNLKKPPVLQPPVNLTYRGVNYANRTTATSESVPTGQNVREKARWLMLNQEKAAKNRNDSIPLLSLSEN